MRFAGPLLLFVAALSCSSSGQQAGSTAAFPDEDVPGREANPDGVAYPTDDLGGRPRAGGRYGQRIPNLTFQGYVRSDRAAGLKVVSLADYFDPESKRYKLLHVMLAASWCSICMAQTREMVAAAAGLEAKGLVTVQALVQGPTPRYGPTLADFDAWLDKHKTTHTMVIDVRGHRFLTVWNFDAVPVNALVDPRTMEILDAGVGAPSSFTAYVDAGFEAVAGPPRK
jgi:hypothetical protein